MYGSQTGRHEYKRARRTSRLTARDRAETTHAHHEVVPGGAGPSRETGSFLNILTSYVERHRPDIGRVWRRGHVRRFDPYGSYV